MGRQKSLRGNLHRQQSVLARRGLGNFGLTARELLAMNEDGETRQNAEALQAVGGVQVLARHLNTDVSKGLPEGDDLELRGKEFGNNFMPTPDPKTWIQLFFQSFQDATLIILIVSAVVSLAVGFYADPEKGWIEGAAILSAVFVVAVVTATNDYSKDKQFRALNAVKDNIMVKVVRQGEHLEMSTRELLVGDLVELECGDKIPADGVLVRGDDLTVNESSLTGEAEDVRKGYEDREDPFLLSGCVLTGGKCSMIVVAVGAESRWGRIKAKLAEEPSDTPLQEKLDALAGLIGYVGMGAAAATFCATMFVYYMNPSRVVESAHLGEKVDTLFEHVLHAFIIAVTIVVVAVPEGLPLAVTISLAYSTKKMLRDNNLIRVLAACETMGNATNICSDKTGTLTENRMTVVAGWFAGAVVHEGEGLPEMSDPVQEIICEGISVNTTARLRVEAEGSATVIGNKTEGALLMVVGHFNQNYYALRQQRLDVDKGDKVFTFSSARKRMSTLIHRPRGDQRVYCKGAAEIILGLCTHRTREDGSVSKLTAKERGQIEDLIGEFGKRALRAVGLAHRDIPASQKVNPKTLNPDAIECDLVLDAIVGIKDPLRADVKEAVELCQSAGIMVRMVTGDNISTARAIAREAGILTDGGVSMEGPQFRHLTPKDLDAVLPKLQVLARSSPDDKYMLVTRLNGRALPKTQAEWEVAHPELDWGKDKDQALPGYWDEWSASRPHSGEVVGVTGDGTNDAPALKAADVGLSMGQSGTDVAKEASDIVIMDDKFSSIVKAVLWGRSVFDNIRKFLQFQLTVNVVALTVTFLGAVSGYEPPLNAVMMLWVNLIMDTMGALALGTEPPTRSLLLRRPYKRNASLVNSLMWRHIAVQSVYQLGLLTWLLLKGAKTYGVQDGSVKHFTIIFNAFVFCQIFNEFNARSITNSWNILKSITRNPMFQAVMTFTCVMQYCIVQYGGDFTRTQALNSDEWVTTVLMGAMALPLGVVMRFLPPRREGEGNFAGYPELANKAASNRARGGGGNGRVPHQSGSQADEEEGGALGKLVTLFEGLLAVTIPIIGVAYYQLVYQPKWVDGHKEL